MSRARRFTKAEIRDAAAVADEHGFDFLITESGRIEFTSRKSARNIQHPKRESMLEKFINESQASGRP